MPTIDGDKTPELAGRILSIHDGRGHVRVAGWGADGAVAVTDADEREAGLLDRCDGSRDIATLAGETAMTAADVAWTLARWEERIPRSFAWLTNASGRAAARHRAIARQLLFEGEAVAPRDAAPVDNRAYHLHEIGDAHQQFEQVERTVSHTYAERHPALSGRTYGEAFCDRCLAMGLLKPGMALVEIGCGTGMFARAFLDRLAREAPAVYESSSYLLFDLSPALARSQQQQCAAHAHVRFEHGNIEERGPSGSFDLAIVNEVIADLAVETVSRADVAAKRPGAKSVADYDLSLRGALDRFLVNAGAIRAIEQLRRSVRPHGAAILTEYGSVDAFPYAVTLGNHVEYSIHFGHLATAAKKLGFDASIEPLTAFLGFVPDTEVIARSSMLLLHAAAPQLLGIEIPARAYDRHALARALGRHAATIGNIRFARVDTVESFMSPAAFLALILRAPAA